MASAEAWPGCISAINVSPSASARAERKAAIERSTLISAPAAAALSSACVKAASATSAEGTTPRDLHTSFGDSHRSPFSWSQFVADAGTMPIDAALDVVVAELGTATPPRNTNTDMPNAPYTGGSSTDADAKLFLVDGDFTKAEPCGAPRISNPLRGDAVPYTAAIVYLASDNAYHAVPAGTAPNIQPNAANQTAIVIDQDFMVATEHHVPLPLNTAYDTTWGLGWKNTYAFLNTCFLVEEGPLEDQGGGISKFRRRFARIPPGRNEWESFNFTYPAFAYGSSIRQALNLTGPSRVQYDYYLLDPHGLQPDAATAIGDIATFPLFCSFAAEASAVLNNLTITPDQPLTDAVLPALSTTPSATDYRSWIRTKEIVVEASTIRRWMGNIFERRTRFMIAQ